MDLNLKGRTQAFQAAAEHDLSFYDQYSSGRIVSRITGDTNEFGQLVTIVTDVGSQLFRAVVLGVVLARTEWHMALVLFSFLPFLFLLAIGYRRIARRGTRRGVRGTGEGKPAIQRRG